jgi:hypothetical protein
MSATANLFFPHSTPNATISRSFPKYSRPIVRGPSPGTADESSTILFVPRTELGRRLWELRMIRIAAGGRLMGMEEIEREIQERRGEQYDERQ